MSRIAIGLAGSNAPLTLSSDQKIKTDHVGWVPATDIKQYVREHPGKTFEARARMEIEDGDDPEWVDAEQTQGLIWARNRDVTFIVVEDD